MPDVKLSRPDHVSRVLHELRRAPVVGVLGPRQVGKTTLALDVAEGWTGSVTRFDLERPADLARLEDPELTLEPLRGLVILDEVQRRPELFPYLRVLADRPKKPARFLILGSASPELLRQESETLAGRIHFHELGGFDASEVPAGRFERLWLRGGFPRSFTAGSDADSFSWREDFIRTFLERDLQPLGINVPAPTLRRLWTMLAHVNGSQLNWSELSRAMGVSDMTVRRYAEQLSATFMIALLQPWHENITKRQVKSPKLYLRDSGLHHALLGIPNLEQLVVNPLVGASWEGFVLEQLRAHLGVEWRNCYFWATQQGAELDLLVFDGTKRFGFEIKRATAPTVTKSMRSAFETLKLERLDVVHAGKGSWPMASGMRAVAFDRMLKEIPKIRAR